MKIEIRPIIESLTDKSLHLRISTPDNNCYNFRVPQNVNGSSDEYGYEYSYESMLALYNLLDIFINRHKT